MSRFTSIAVAAGLVVASVAPAFAGDVTVQKTKAEPSLQRVVMLCETGAATRSSFRREHGAPPVFVTAREVVAARSANETWTTPRCMTAREHGQLLRLLSSYAAR